VSQITWGKYLNIMKLPEELSHLERFSGYAKRIKGTVWGFYIPQFIEGTNNINYDWLDFRTEVIGSSEIGTVLGNNKYGSTLKVWHEKVFKEIPPQFNNADTIYGRFAEPIIGKYWEHYDGVESWIDNIVNSVEVRKLRNINCFAVNTKFPYLSASIDYMAHGNQESPFTGSNIPHPFPVECKAIKKIVSDMYEAGLPPNYFDQIKEQCIVMEVDYGEIAYLVEREFKVQSVTITEDDVAEVLLKAKEFWDNVQLCRELYSLYDENEDADIRAEIMSRIYSNEPIAQGGENEEKFLKDKWKNIEEESVIQGDLDTLKIRNEYIEVKDLETQMRNKKSELKNKLLQALKDNQRMNWEEYGEEGEVVFKRKDEHRAREYFAVK